MSSLQSKQRASVRPGSKGRILADSADVEAALAAVRARTEKLKLESPEGDMKRLYATNNKDSGATRSQSEKRQPSSHQQRTSKHKHDVLDQATLDSVSKYIGVLNNSSYQVPTTVNKQKAIKDDDSFSSCSDESNGGNNVHLQDISAMIDKVQKQKSSAAVKPKTQMKATNANKVQSTMSSQNKQNLKSINAMISKVNKSIHQGSSGNQIARNIRTVSSDISSDDSSIEEGKNISSATQANLALYIDSLKTPRTTAPSQIKVLPMAITKKQTNTIAASIGSPQNRRSPIVNKSTRVQNSITSISNPNAKAQRTNDTLKKVEPIRVGHVNSNMNITTQITAAPTFVAQNTSTVSSINVAKHKSTLNKSPRVKASTYDDIKLQSYIEKAKEINNKPSPRINEVEYIIIYARRDGVPIEPILRAFDTDDNTRQHFSDPIIFHNNSSDDEAETANESEEKVVSMEHRNIQKLVFYLYEAISLVENSIMSEVCTADLLERARDEGVDDALIREIFKNPQKHVKYENQNETYDVLTETNSSEDERFAKEKQLRKEPDTNLIEEQLLWQTKSSNSENVKHQTSSASEEMDRATKEVISNTKTVDEGTKEVVSLESNEGNMIDTEKIASETMSRNEMKTNTDLQAENLDQQVDETKSSYDDSDDGVPATRETVAPQISTSDSYASSTSSSPPNLDKSKSDSNQFNTFLARDDSFTDQQRYENLDSNEKYLLKKIKQLDKAKQIATGRTGRAREVINEDGTKSIVAVPPPPLRPVKATKSLRKRRILKDYPSIVPVSYLQQWKTRPKDRVAGHPNYKQVQMDTFNCATQVTDIMDPSDDIPWEEKEMKQFFLHDVDIRRANWFGKYVSIF